MSESLLIHEIYLSLQGESTYAGLPCVFVRTTGCNLRCSYCDTAYAFSGGQRLGIAAIMKEVEKLARSYAVSTSEPRLPLVELTGGEPLVQPGSFSLMTMLCDGGFTVLLETSGAHPITLVDRRVRRIVDIKSPSSGEEARNHWANLEELRDTDEVKFVVGTIEDYEWMKGILEKHKLASMCPVLVSSVTPLLPGQRDKSLKSVPLNQVPLSRQALAERLITDRLPVRFQLQMHKFIWPADQRGV